MIARKIPSLNRGGVSCMMGIQMLLLLLLVACSTIAVTAASSSSASSSHNSRPRREQPRGLKITVTPRASLSRKTTTPTPTMSTAKRVPIITDIKELGMDLDEQALALRSGKVLPSAVQVKAGDASEEEKVGIWKWWTTSIVATAVYWAAFIRPNGGDNGALFVKRGGKLHPPVPPPTDGDGEEHDEFIYYETPADDHPLALQSEEIIVEEGVLSWLFSSEKLPWTLSAIASLVYLGAFVSRVSCDKTDSPLSAALCWPKLSKMTDALHNGFCVWGSDPKTGLCSSWLQNSHQYSFYADTIMTILAFVVGHAYKGRVGSASFPFTFGVALIIGLHGLLHLSISNGVECGAGKWLHCGMACPNDPSGSSAATQPWQWVLYGFYNLGLVLLNFAVANFRMPIAIQALLVPIITAAFVALGWYFGGSWALPAVFVQTHVMASITGIFANRMPISPLTGWCFLAATLAGLTEFLACEPFLLARGGHVWYDAILHLAMITTLVPRDGTDLAWWME